MLDGFQAAPRTVHNICITAALCFWQHPFARTYSMNPGVRNLCVTHAGVLEVFPVMGVSVFRAFARIPLLCRPGHDYLDDLGHQEQANGSAQILAHGLHVAVLKFYGRHSHENDAE